MDKEKDQNRQQKPMDEKDAQLEQFREKNTGPGKKMTDDTGVRVSNDQTTLRAGRRGPLLFFLKTFISTKNNPTLIVNGYQRRSFMLEVSMYMVTLLPINLLNI